MSTRSTTHFTYDPKGQPEAIIYRHSDGYPSGAGRDLLNFFEQCAALSNSMNGTRLNDPSYLAARYVVFLADMFNADYTKRPTDGIYPKNASKLDFIGVGVMATDPGDIEYRYVVDCSAISNGRPKLTCYEVSDTYDREAKCDRPMSDWTLTEAPIPAEGE